jgi:hypothetical protein
MHSSAQHQRDVNRIHSTLAPTSAASPTISKTQGGFESVTRRPRKSTSCVTQAPVNDCVYVARMASATASTPRARRGEGARGWWWWWWGGAGVKTAPLGELRAGMSCPPPVAWPVADCSLHVGLRVLFASVASCQQRAGGHIQEASQHSLGLVGCM